MPNFRLKCTLMTDNCYEQGFQLSNAKSRFIAEVITKNKSSQSRFQWIWLSPGALGPYKLTFKSRLKGNNLKSQFFVTSVKLPYSASELWVCFENQAFMLNPSIYRTWIIRQKLFLIAIYPIKLILNSFLGHLEPSGSWRTWRDHKSIYWPDWD